jgi:hypothetical protein
MCVSTIIFCNVSIWIWRIEIFCWNMNNLIIFFWMPTNCWSKQYYLTYTYWLNTFGFQVNKYYDLVTSFYEFGWGESFHFAPRYLLLSSTFYIEVLQAYFVLLPLLIRLIKNETFHVSDSKGSLSVRASSDMSTFLLCNLAWNLDRRFNLFYRILRNQQEICFI